MKRVPFGLLNNDNNDAVFVCFHSINKLNHKYKELENNFVNVALMQLRWDGKIGFVGGKVDPKEDLITALVREVKEEIDFEIPNLDDLQKICSHSFSIGEKTLNTHLYSYFLPFEEIKELMHNSLNSDDFFYESNGCFLVHMENYTEKGFNEFLKNNFASSVKEELIILSKTLNPSLELDFNLSSSSIF